eukprot:47889_1
MSFKTKRYNNRDNSSKFLQWWPDLADSVDGLSQNSPKDIPKPVRAEDSLPKLPSYVVDYVFSIAVQEHNQSYETALNTVEALRICHQKLNHKNIAEKTILACLLLSSKYIEAPKRQLRVKYLARKHVDVSSEDNFGWIANSQSK